MLEVGWVLVGKGEWTLCRRSYSFEKSKKQEPLTTCNRNTALYAQGAGLGASKGKDITEVAGLDYAALAKASVSLLFPVHNVRYL